MPRLAIGFIPIMALAAQLAFVPQKAHFTWFLFFPAVFLCSWLGARAAGLLSSIFSAFLVAGLGWTLFIAERTVENLPAIFGGKNGAR